MSTIPPHFSDRYINQRYNKALQIVQHLPSSASFQPTREEKLELYACYKQVTQGNVSTQRPGMFDMVGRAKWYVGVEGLFQGEWAYVKRSLAVALNVKFDGNRDAWKKLEGISQLEAKHMYVEILLRSATEAYKKNVGRATAQQIIQTFAAMKYSADSDEEITDTQQEDDSSVGSADAEEQAYLRAIQDSAGRSTPAAALQSQKSFRDSPDGRLLMETSPVVRPTSRSASVRTRQANRRSWYEHRRPDSVASTQSGQVSLVTAPTPSGRLSQASDPVFHTTKASSTGQTTPARQLLSSASQHPPASSQPTQKSIHTDRLLPHMMPPHERAASRLSRTARLLDSLDDSVNPWAQSPHMRAGRLRSDSGDSDSDSDFEHGRSGNATSSHASHTPTAASPLPFRVAQSRLSASRSPRPHGRSRFKTAQRPAGVSAGTASPSMASVRPDSSASVHTVTESRPQPASGSTPAMSVVALGPATKRALESLQAEVVALNERIDDLQRELAERDRHGRQKQGRVGSAQASGTSKSSEDDEMWDGWKWVLKAAAKHAAINVTAVVAIIMILYSRESPIAYAITGQISRMWHNVKLRVISGAGTA